MEMNEKEPSNYVLDGVALIAQMDLPEDWGRLGEDRQRHLMIWISHRVRRWAKWNRDRRESSYGLKMQYEEESGKYVTHGQMKGAMARMGYGCENERMLEWHYRCKLRKLTAVNKEKVGGTSG